MLLNAYLQKQMLALPAELHSLLPDSYTLQRLALVDQVVCVSTGLFQTGHPVMSHYFAVQDQTLTTKQYVLQVGGSLAASSAVPALQAIAQGAQEAGLPLREMEVESKEQGVLGRLERTWYVLGDAAAMHSQGIELGMSSQTLTHQLEIEGRIIWYLAQKQPKRLLAIFACEIPMRAEVPDMVQGLHSLGIDLTVLTGQKTRLAKGMLQPLGVDLIHSELTTEEKSRLLESLRQRHPNLATLCTVQNISLSPAGTLVLLQSRKALRSGQVAMHHLSDLVPLIQEAREIMQRARHRFFWLKI